MPRGTVKKVKANVKATKSKPAKETVRKPGRPKGAKNKTKDEESEEEKPKRGRGRPKGAKNKKSKAEEESEVEVEEESEEDETSDEESPPAKKPKKKAKAEASDEDEGDDEIELSDEDEEDADEESDIDEDSEEDEASEEDEEEDEASEEEEEADEESPPVKKAKPKKKPAKDEDSEEEADEESEEADEESEEAEDEASEEDETSEEADEESEEEEKPKKAKKPKGESILVSINLDVDAMSKEEVTQHLVKLGVRSNETSEKALKKLLTKALEGVKQLNPKSEAVREALPSILKCFGLFRDHTSPFCNKCPHSTACQQKFDENVRDNFPQLRKQYVEEAQKEEAAKPKPKKEEKPAKKAKVEVETEAEDEFSKPKEAKAGVVHGAVLKDGTKITLDSRIRVLAEDNAFKGKVIEDFIDELLEEEPRTIGDLLDIYAKHRDDNDPLPTKPGKRLAVSAELIQFLRKQKVIKLRTVQPE